MKKTTIIMLFSLILLALPSLAQAQLYDDYLSDGQDITILGIQFKVSHDTERNELQLDSKYGALLIPQGDSRTLDNKIFKFVDVTSGRYHLIVDTYQASTYIERTLKTKEVYLGNNAEVMVLIQNNGNSVVKNVIFSQEFEEDKFISNTFYKITRANSGGNNNNNINKEEIVNITDVSFIRWQGDLQPKEQITLVYYAIPVTSGINNQLELMPAKIMYEEAGLQLELFSEKDIIRTKNIVKAQIEFINAKQPEQKINTTDTAINAELTEELEYFKIGTIVNYKLVLTNIYNSAAVVQDFALVIPEELQVLSKDKNLIKENNTLLWTGKINNDESKEFLFSVKADKRFNANFSIRFNTPLGKFDLKNDYNKAITFDVARLEPVIQFNKDDTGNEYISNDKLNYRITFNNPDALSFFSLLSNFTIDFFEKNISYLTLPDKNEILLADQTIQLPFADKKKQFTALFSGVYNTSGNEQISFSKTKTISINPGEFDKIYAIDYLYYKFSNDSTVGFVFARIDIKNFLKQVQRLRIKTTFTDKYGQMHSVISNYDANEAARITEKRPAGQLLLFPLENLTDDASASFSFTTELQYAVKDQYYYQENTVALTLDELIQRIKEGHETSYFDIGRFLSKQAEFEALLKEESIKVYEEKTVSTKNTVIIIFIIMTVIIAIVAANIITKRLSKSKYAYKGAMLKKDAAADIFKAPKPTFDYAVLHKYIAFCRQNNISKFKTRQNLIKEGWLPAIIDEFIK
ncbi:hypothetical protein HZA96_03805 [Candidatus Woesearchaeota archaeon]|nr:hypothetical protein [Candidatus Woesearchaeota archaeon]